MQHLIDPEYRLVLIIEDGEEWIFPDYALGGLSISKAFASSITSDGNSLQNEGSVFLFTVVDHVRRVIGHHGW